MPSSIIRPACQLDPVRAEAGTVLSIGYNKLPSSVSAIGSKDFTGAFN